MVSAYRILVRIYGHSSVSLTIARKQDEMAIVLFHVLKVIFSKANTSTDTLASVSGFINDIEVKGLGVMHNLISRLLVKNGWACDLLHYNLAFDSPLFLKREACQTFLEPCSLKSPAKWFWEKACARIGTRQVSFHSWLRRFGFPRFAFSLFVSCSVILLVKVTALTTTPFETHLVNFLCLTSNNTWLHFPCELAIKVLKRQSLLRHFLIKNNLFKWLINLALRHMHLPIKRMRFVSN